MLVGGLSISILSCGNSFFACRRISDFLQRVGYQGSNGYGSGIVNTARLFLCGKLMALLPETRLFALKASLLRWAGVEVGSNVRICSSVTILGTESLSIGENTWIGPQVFISASADISIGSNVDIAPRAYIGTGTHEIDPVGPHSAGAGKAISIVIKDGVWLGAGALILPGVTIGQKAVVAAGAVVATDVDARTIVAGVPAKPIGTIDDNKYKT